MVGCRLAERFGWPVTAQGVQLGGACLGPTRGSTLVEVVVQSMGWSTYSRGRTNYNRA